MVASSVKPLRDRLCELVLYLKLCSIGTWHQLKVRLLVLVLWIILRLYIRSLTFQICVDTPRIQLWFQLLLFFLIFSFDRFCLTLLHWCSGLRWNLLCFDQFLLWSYRRLLSALWCVHCIGHLWIWRFVVFLSFSHPVQHLRSICIGKKHFLISTFVLLCILTQVSYNDYFLGFCGLSFRCGHSVLARFEIWRVVLCRWLCWFVQVDLTECLSHVLGQMCGGFDFRRKIKVLGQSKYDKNHTDLFPWRWLLLTRHAGASYWLYKLFSTCNILELLSNRDICKFDPWRHP